MLYLFRYLFRLFILLVIWPGVIIAPFVIIMFINLISILWYFNFKHLIHEFKTKHDFWFPTNTGDSEWVIRNAEFNSLVYFSEYYKTPMDLLLDRRTRIYKIK